MSIVYTLLVAHFIGDFVCQSDWMAINKSKRWDALALHLLCYLPCLLGAAWVSDVFLGSEFSNDDLNKWMVVNLAAHFVQDAITSRINSWLYPRSRHWFFVSIGFDQLLHYVTLFVTAGWWLK